MSHTKTKHLNNSINCWKTAIPRRTIFTINTERSHIKINCNSAHTLVSDSKNWLLDNRQNSLWQPNSPKLYIAQLALQLTILRILNPIRASNWTILTVFFIADKLQHLIQTPTTPKSQEGGYFATKQQNVEDCYKHPSKRQIKRIIHLAHKVDFQGLGEG